MLTSLDWLETAPADFKEQLRALGRDLHARPASEVAEAIVALAAYALDENQLVKLARLSTDFLARGGAAPLQTLKLGVFGDGTLSLIAPVITGSGLRHRLLIETFEGEFNRALLDATDPSSPVRTAGLDMALIVSDARVLGLAQGATSRASAEETVQRAYQQLRQTVDNLRRFVTAAIFVQSVVPPVEPLFGSFDRVEDVLAIRDDRFVESTDCRLGGGGRHCSSGCCAARRKCRSGELGRPPPLARFEAQFLTFAAARLRRSGGADDRRGSRAVPQMPGA